MTDINERIDNGWSNFETYSNFNSGNYYERLIGNSYAMNAEVFPHNLQDNYKFSPETWWENRYSYFQGDEYIGPSEVDDIRDLRDWALERAHSIKNSAYYQYHNETISEGATLIGGTTALISASQIFARIGKAASITSLIDLVVGKIAKGAVRDYESIAAAAQKHIDIFELNKCFSGNTLIRTDENIEKRIEEIFVGDFVLSFDPLADNGRGALVPKTVLRTFTNITTEWLRLTWVEDGETKELVTTPGHQFLAAHGRFREIESLVAGGRGTVVLADGSETEVVSERIVYSAETADMFEQAEGYVISENGNLALKPVFKKGWKTYNFEVEDFHTYVAGGVRVHNDSYDDGVGFEYASW